MDKRYDEALERARAGMPIDEVFPELKESEDERIRKWLIEEIKATHDYDSPTSRKCVDDALAYLERQKEPKDYRKLYEEVVKSDWFKENYFGKSLGEEQKSAEWSMGDENALVLFHELISFGYTKMFCDAQTAEDMRKMLNTWVKSIRCPQSHWKPSEYTLSIVKKVADGEMLTSMEQMAMGTLYNDLKKL